MKVGDVPIGGGAPVSVQTMCNADPHDAAACRAQLDACAARGCDIFRMTVPDAAAAAVLGEVRRGASLPIVAAFHFKTTPLLIPVAFRLVISSTSTGFGDEQDTKKKIGKMANKRFLFMIILQHLIL